MRDKKLIVIGRVVKPFGIRGEIRIRPYTESFEIFEKSEYLYFERKLLRIDKVRIHKSGILVMIDGIQTPEQAKELVGFLVQTEASNLPPTQDDEYYWHELIGLAVFTVDGRDLGILTGITPTGANDVFHVEGNFGEVLLPMIDDVIIDIDLEEGKITVDPLEGLIPDV